MRTIERAWIRTAVVLLIVGAVIAAAASSLSGFDFAELSNNNYEQKTYTVSDSFSSVFIESADCDVRFAVSDDGICRVDCPETDKITHSVNVNGTTLEVVRVDNRKWYEHIGIFMIIPDNEIVVYLPVSAYESLRVATVSGDIEIPIGLSFGSAELVSTSGDIKCTPAIIKSLSAKTVSGDISVTFFGTEWGTPETLNASSTSGDIDISGAALSEGLSVKTVSGDIKLSAANCKSVTAGSTSGNVTLFSVLARDSLTVSTVSGNVRFDSCDADELDIKTTSGNVTGTLVTLKIFSADTVSGRVNIPASGANGSCRIKTTSGNINISVSE